GDADRHPVRQRRAATMILVTRLVMALALLAWLPGLLEQFETPKAAVVRVLGGGLLAAAFASLVARRTVSAPAKGPVPPTGDGPRWHTLDLAIAAWLAVEVAATLFSVAPAISLLGDRAPMEGLLTPIGLAGIYPGPGP